jgi:hypothetical protein
MTTTARAYRLAQYAHGGGCACRLPPGEPEAAVAGLVAGLSTVDELVALLLAGAQTSGGLLLAGEVPGAPVTGELVSRGRYGDRLIVVR